MMTDLIASLHWVNQVFLGLILILCIGIIVNLWRYRPWARARFNMYEGAPYDYPMRTFGTTLILEDGTKYDRMAAKDDADAPISGAWGRLYEAYDYESLRLPKALQVSWLSLSEKKFYKGNFVLPIRKRNRVFRYFKYHPSHKTERKGVCLSIG